jgi:N-acetyltransferase 10
MSLLAYDSFKKFDSSTSLSVIDATSPRSLTSAQSITPRTITADELNALITPFDMKRLNSYADNMVEYHVILDLVPILAALYFGKKLGEECTLSAAQQAILLALGLQRKDVDALEVCDATASRADK